MSRAWNENEVSVICSAYAELLSKEQAGIPFNKAAKRREIVPLLDGRTAGSYEMKMCNISAALNDAERPYIKGYKPLKGYQKCLKAAIVEAINTAPMWVEA